MELEPNANWKAVTASGFRLPQPKPGLNVPPPGTLGRIRRLVGGTLAYLASWWRY